MTLKREAAQNALRRMFGGGQISRLPKRPEDADLFLALAASSLMPRHRYTEAEVNEALQEWMSGFCDGPHMDHVTLRRCLVDRSLLLRDAAGRHYTQNGTVITTIIDADAATLRPLAIYSEVQRERSARKRQRRDTRGT